MGEATREFYVEVLRKTLGILDEAAADHLVIGGVYQAAKPHVTLDLIFRAGETSPAAYGTGFSTSSKRADVIR